MLAELHLTFANMEVIQNYFGQRGGEDFVELINYAEG